MERVFEMPPDFESVKNRLLAEFPREHLEGINTERVENFIRQEGLEIKPFIIFDKKDLQKVKELTGNINLTLSEFDDGASGLYNPELDLIFIARDKDYEKSSGTIYTEGILAHELAHASSMYQGYIATNRTSYNTPRVGFCFPPTQLHWGWLLEEGWADMHRADYFAQNASDEQRGRLEEALMFGSLDMNDTIPITYPTGEIFPLPLKYCFVAPEGLQTKRSAYAGYALELLCKKDPSIKSLLIEARSSVEGLRKLAQAIEKVMPGLYKTLQTSDYTESGFLEKLTGVISNVAGGIENVITAKGALKNKWNDILEKKDDIASNSASL